MWDKFPAIQKDLDLIKSKMSDEFRKGHPIVRRALTDFIDNNGKMLRSGLFVICSRFGDINLDKLIKIGAAIEMLHLATLIHDDIIDDSEIRRGLPAIHKKYGKRDAVLIGDYLFSKAFVMVSEYAQDIHIKLLTRVLTSICGSELIQSSQLYRKTITIRQYLRRIIGKTASLFSLSCYIGGLESGCNNESNHILGRIGYYSGISFQIIDDILDIEGKKSLLGKPVHTDLSLGIFTMPVICAIQNDDGKLSKMLDKFPYSERKINKIIHLVKEYDGINKAREFASRYTEKAKTEIERLPNVDNKNVLSSIIQELLSRNN